jgi:hypothetical protein
LTCYTDLDPILARAPLAEVLESTSNRASCIVVATPKLTILAVLHGKQGGFSFAESAIIEDAAATPDFYIGNAVIVILIRPLLLVVFRVDTGFVV